MKVHCLHQSQLDGDLYVLRVNKTPLTILYGSITRQSSLLRYLPRNYSDFVANKPIEDSTEINQGEPQQKLKRAKHDSLTDAMETLTTLTTCPEDHVPWKHQSKFTLDDQAIISSNSLMHNVEDHIFFTSKFPVRMQLKTLNVVTL